MALHPNDLEYLVSNIFEVDSYASKRGEDKDVVVLSFTVEDKGPAEDLVNIAVKGLVNTNYNVTITDITGKVVFKNQLNDMLNNNAASVNVSEFNKGMYFIMLSNEQGTSTQKLIVR
jgi:hypothetical protein